MLIVLFVIFLGLFISGLLVLMLTDNGDDNPYSYIASFFGAVFLLAVIIIMIIGAVNIVQKKVIDEKIVMYQEENQNIEDNITRTVERYLEHEQSVYESFQGEDIQTLLVVYPEIKSNELVSYQLEVFVQNNTRIKKLKEQKLNINLWKFWLYFG